MSRRKSVVSASAKSAESQSASAAAKSAESSSSQSASAAAKSALPIICMNGQQMDIQLEAEKNAGDIYDGMERWLAADFSASKAVAKAESQEASKEASKTESQATAASLHPEKRRMIQRLELNEKEIDLSVEDNAAATAHDAHTAATAHDAQIDWRATPIHNVQRMNFVVCFVGDMLLDGLAEWDGFVDRIGSRLVARAQELAREFPDSATPDSAPQKAVLLFSEASESSEANEVIMNNAAPSTPSPTKAPSPTKPPSGTKPTSPTKPTDEWQELCEGLVWMQDLAAALANLDGCDFAKWQRAGIPIKEILQDLKKEMPALQKEIPLPVALEWLQISLDRFRHLKSFIKMLSIQWMAKYTPLFQLLQEFANILSRAKTLPDSWQSINVDLQQANDLRAMEKLHKKAGELHEMIDWMNVLAHKVQSEHGVNLLELRLTDGDDATDAAAGARLTDGVAAATGAGANPHADANSTFAQFMEESLSKRLQLFVEHLDRQDLVTVGDMVEYEFPQVFARLVQYMEVILQKSQTWSSAKYK